MIALLWKHVHEQYKSLLCIAIGPVWALEQTGHLSICSKLLALIVQSF